MRILKGTVEKGHGCRVASDNLAPVMDLIESKMGLATLVNGTLNILISEDYIVRHDAFIPPDQYPYNRTHGTNETIKLQRCLVRGRKAIIMRPDSHELGRENPGRKRLELMGTVKFRDEFSIPLGSVVEVEVEVEGDDAWWESGT
jgi:CTP-dependent riboflavin kinase